MRPIRCASNAGADTTSTVLAAGPLFRRIWTRTAGTLADTLTDSSSAIALTFLKQRRYWSATTGALDSIVVGTSMVRFTVDAELLPDSTIYPTYNVARFHTSTHEDYSSIYSTRVLDSVFSRTYSFDSLGRITSEAHVNGYQNGWTNDVRGYAYNASGPLRWYERATTTNRTCEPDYGCRLASTVPYETYTYPHYDAALNLLTRVDSIDGNAKDSAVFAVGDRVTSWLGASYTYDADGNRATRKVGSTTTTYTWDASGRLLQVKTGTDSVTYAYNALGDLARRSTKGRVDRWFVWEQGQLLEELDSTGQHRENAFAYLPGTDQPLARITGDGSTVIEFAQQDERGDVIGFTHGTGVTQHLLFGPWGNLEWQGGDSLPQTRLGWTGLVWEGGTAQLYYVRSRWYDPASRSFLSEDPLGLSGGRNTYAYADNDPVNGSDPSGTSMGMNCDGVQIDWYDEGIDASTGDVLYEIYLYSTCNRGGGGRGGGGGSGGDASARKKVVVRHYSKTMVCNANATQVMNAVENDFSTFGDFSRWGLEGVWFYPLSTMQAGSTIPILVQINTPLIPIRRSISVTVESATSQSLTFTTNPGHLLYPAHITFAASTSSLGSVTFNIDLAGIVPNGINSLEFEYGGGSFENGQWNHFLEKVDNFCKDGR